MSSMYEISPIVLGYRDRSDLLFKSMNYISEKRVKQRIESRDHAGGERCDADLRSTSDSVATISVQNWRLEPSLLTPQETSRPLVTTKRKAWQETVIECFFADWAIHTDVFPENLDFLPMICSKPEQCAYIEEALGAVAFVSQANQLKIEWLSVSAARYYGRALLLLAEAFKHPNEAKNDTVLAAMFLVSLYEVSKISGLAKIWRLEADPCRQ